MPTTLPASTTGTLPQSLSRMMLATSVIESPGEQQQGDGVISSRAFISFPPSFAIRPM
jgi:hypothetical protein